MKFPKIQVRDKEAFERQLMSWTVMRDAIGGGSWVDLAHVLGVDQFTHGPKRIRKKRIRRYMAKMVMQDLMEVGRCQKV